MISEIGALVSTKGGVLSTKRCTCQQQSSAAACTGQQHRDTNTAAATTKRQHVQPHVHTETQIQQQLRRRDNTCRRRYNIGTGHCPYLRFARISDLSVSQDNSSTMYHIIFEEVYFERISHVPDTKEPIDKNV